MTLCIDEDSGLIVEEGEANAERFFEPDGKLSVVLGQLAELLRRSEQDLVHAQWISAALAEAGLIKPWLLTVTVGGRQIAMEGLHSVDEAALNALDDQLFLELRKKSALALGLRAITVDWTSSKGAGPTCYNARPAGSIGADLSGACCRWISVMR